MILTKSWLGYDLPVEVIEAHPAVQTLRSQGIEKLGKREYHLLVAYFESADTEEVASLIAETEAQSGASLAEAAVAFDGYGMIESPAGTYAYFSPSTGGAKTAAALKARMAAAPAYDVLKNCRDLHMSVGGPDPFALDKPKRGPLKVPFEVRGRLVLVGFAGEAYMTLVWSSASHSFVEEGVVGQENAPEKTKPAAEPPKIALEVSQPTLIETPQAVIEVAPKLPVQEVFSPAQHVVHIEEKKITIEERPPAPAEKKPATPAAEPKPVAPKPSAAAPAPIPAAPSPAPSAAVPGPVAGGAASKPAITSEMPPKPPDAIPNSASSGTDSKPAPAAQTPVKKLLLPTKVMPDVACAAYLLRAYGAKQFPGVAEAEFAFASELAAGKTPEALAKEGILAVDRRTESSANYFAKILGVADRPELRKLLSYAKRDFERKASFSNDPLDKMFGLAGIALAMNRVYAEDPRAVLDFLTSIFEAMAYDESRKTSA